MRELIAPVSYQGGKQRLSRQIIEEINSRVDLKGKTFIDLCCGSGAVGLESLIYCSNAVFVDKREMGNFYSSLNDFSLRDFKKEIDLLPEIEEIKDYLTQKSKEEVPTDNMQRVYLYLLLQAGAFGSKQIWIEDKNWKNCSFRSYWKPTLTSNRRSPVNPMMPMPETLYQRVKNIVEQKEFITGYQKDITDFIDSYDFTDCIVYLDPPYKDTTGYFDSLDIVPIIDKLKGRVPLFVSYNEDLTEDTIEFGKRTKGNMNGVKKTEVVREILNCFDKG